MDVVKILTGLPTITSRIIDNVNAFKKIHDANEMEKTVKKKTHMFLVNSSLLHITEGLRNKKEITRNEIKALPRIPHVVTD
jgi:hypothetical protein